MRFCSTHKHMLMMKRFREHGFALFYIAEVIAMYDNVVDYGMISWAPLFCVLLWSIPTVHLLVE